MLVGTPLLASPANLAFWIGLCSAWRVPGIAAEMERFRSHAAQGARQLENFAFDYNQDMVTKVGSIGLQSTSIRDMECCFGALPSLCCAC